MVEACHWSCCTNKSAIRTPSARRFLLGCEIGCEEELAACKTLGPSKKSSTILRVARLRHWRRPRQLTELGLSLVAHGHNTPLTRYGVSPVRIFQI